MNTQGNENRAAPASKFEAVAAPEPTGAALSISGLSKTFWRGGQQTHALHEIDLTIEPGAFVCLLGPSGCGKSTLLHTVAGFIGPDAGDIVSFGTPVSGPGSDRCVLFQSPTLFPWLTSRDNVLFGPRARGLDINDAKARADVLLETVGLADFSDHYPHQLSGGMRHRASLARALINKPRIMLMDEPFAALDAITREQMQNFLLELWQRERMTVLFVTHDVEEAALLSDRVVIMSARPGRVIDEVDVDLERPRDAALRDTPEFVALRHELRERLAQA